MVCEQKEKRKENVQANPSATLCAFLSRASMLPHGRQFRFRPREWPRKLRQSRHCAFLPHCYIVTISAATVDKDVDVRADSVAVACELVFPVVISLVRGGGSQPQSQINCLRVSQSSRFWICIQYIAGLSFIKLCNKNLKYTD